MLQDPLHAPPTRIPKVWRVAYLKEWFNEEPAALIKGNNMTWVVVPTDNLWLVGQLSRTVTKNESEICSKIIILQLNN